MDEGQDGTSHPDIFYVNLKFALRRVTQSRDVTVRRDNHHSKQDQRSDGLLQQSQRQGIPFPYVRKVVHGILALIKGIRSCKV
jgi:hypothetical protein